MAEEKEKRIDKFMKEYDKLRRKYALPEFRKLNEEFEIEKIADKRTEFPLRNIRRGIEQRAELFLKMLEEFINPTFASIASLTILKSFSEKDRGLIKRCYENIVDLILSSAVLETGYDEKKEAEYIKFATKLWGETNKDLNVLMTDAQRIWKKKIEEEKVEFKFSG